MTAAWVRRQRWVAGLQPQAVAFRQAPKEPDFWDMVGTLTGVQVVNVEAGSNGDQAG